MDMETNSLAHFLNKNALSMEIKSKTPLVGMCVCMRVFVHKTIKF